jgi:hypothetical protein
MEEVGQGSVQKTTHRHPLAKIRSARKFEDERAYPGTRHRIKQGRWVMAGSDGGDHRQFVASCGQSLTDPCDYALKSANNCRRAQLDDLQGAMGLTIEEVGRVVSHL